MKDLIGVSPSQLAAVRTSMIIATAYGITSMSTSFAFKALLSSWNFDAKFLMLGIQMTLTTLVCMFLQSQPSLSSLPGLEVPAKLDWKVAFSPLSVWQGTLFVVNIAVGLVGLQLVNVPMFLAIRRTGTAFALGAEYFVLGKVASRETMFAVSLGVSGAILAGWDSLQRDGLGYAWTVANNILTAMAVAYSKKFSDQHGLRGFGLPLYNAVIALPLCYLLAGVTGEMTYTANYPDLAAPGFMTALLAASLLGVWTNYIHFLCGVHIGPLAMSIVGNVKDILATILGIILPFGGTPFVPTPRAVMGLCISLAGAILFSYSKLKEVRAGGGGAHGQAHVDKLTPSSSAPRLEGADETSAEGEGDRLIVKERDTPTSTRSR